MVHKVTDLRTGAYATPHPGGAGDWRLSWPHNKTGATLHQHTFTVAGDMYKLDRNTGYIIRRDMGHYSG